MKPLVLSLVLTALLALAGCGGSKPPVVQDEPSVPAPLIRVGLQVHVAEAVIGSTGPFTLADDDGVLVAGRADQQVRVRRTGDRLLVYGFEGKLLASTGGRLRLRPDRRDGEVTVDGIRYPDCLDVLASPREGINVLNVVDVETYLRGVVPREIGHQGDFLEAAKAQAVAARTYVAFYLGQHGEEGYDVGPGVNDQVYGSLESRHPDADRAVAATRGLILVHDGAPLRANYSSTCGGKTADVSEAFDAEGIPYLRAQDDEVDGLTACRTSKYFRWEVVWTGEELNAILARTVPAATGKPWRGRSVREVGVADRGKSGRAVVLEIETEDAAYRVRKGAIRRVLARPEGGNLRSTAFELKTEKKDGRITRLTAKGRGWGHGVGMCQWGAMQLSRDGHDFRRILEHYYPGAELEFWYRDLQTQHGRDHDSDHGQGT